MRRIGELQLWVGHVGDCRDLTAIQDAGIVALVDLAMNEPPLTPPREMAYCRFPLLDGEGNPAWMIRAAVETVAEFLRSAVPTLVYCSAGMSRSLAILAAALAEAQGCSLREMVTEVASGGPADLSAGLIAEIAAARTRS